MSVDFLRKEHYDINDLLEIMKLLRGEGGCPWDMEQTHKSIRNDFIEETYEVVEAIDNSDSVLLQEELGDVLLQVVFHSRIEEEKGVFNFNDVCDGICQKLINRHPHVFGDTVVKNSSDVLVNWDKIKKEEKHQTTATDTLNAVSKALPSLTRSCKVQKRAAKVGFDYNCLSDAIAQTESEMEELKAGIRADDKENIAEELGDLLFAVVNVSRFLKLDPEQMLYMATDKFIGRFAKMEAMASENSTTLQECSYDELNNLWKKAKAK